MIKALKYLVLFIVANTYIMAQTCPTIGSFDAVTSLPNPCIKSVFYSGINNPAAGPAEISFDYGDGNSSPTYTLPAVQYNFFSATPNYSTAGTYVFTMNVDGPGDCHTSATYTFNTFCNSCPTYSNLSTGFDRSANAPFVGNEGNFDPYWYVMKKQEIASPSFTPVAGTETYYSGVLAYDVVPNGGYIMSHTSGGAKYISINSSMLSTDPVPNVVTYRTYFNLPNPLPANKTYSLAMNMFCDDGVYQVMLNGHDIKSPGYVSAGNSYAGPPLTISANSCDNSFFLPDSNYIDILVSDVALAATQLSAEIFLYDCAAICISTPCEDCIGSFSPIPGKKYLISGWVKEDGAAQSKTSYTYPSLTVKYPSLADSSGPFFASGDIIDGWQRVEGVFVIPALATDLNIKLDCSTGDCYFDDIRVFPFDGSMKSYVYDPVNKRLTAELDERNYATLYEYDEEGGLVRVKKETQKGIMTIKENRNNTKKQ